jgi:hypothetical protein
MNADAPVVLAELVRRTQTAMQKGQAGDTLEQLTEKWASKKKISLPSRISSLDPECLTLACLWPLLIS